MKLYWLFLKPYAFLDINDNQLFIYNTLNGEYYYSENTAEISFLKGLKIKSNLGVIRKKEKDITNTKHQKVLSFIKDFFKDKEINTEETLEIIATILVVESKAIEKVGLLYGRMGIIIFLYHYSREVSCSMYGKVAEYLLDKVCEDVLLYNNIDFATGLAGFGWGIEYLSQNGFIEGDTNDILKDFDCKIMEINPLRVSNLNLEYGLGGIVHYVISRLYTYENLKKEKPFDTPYLNDLYKKINLIIKDENTDHDSMDIFIKFKLYYENEVSIEKPSIYDVVSLIWPHREYIPSQFPMYLKGGNAGIGLKLMFEKNEIKSLVPA